MLSLSQRPLSASDADHRLFVDRNSELDRVHRSLGLGLNVYVHGARGMGKTTFLHQVHRSHPGAYYCRIKDPEVFKGTLVELERVVGRRSGLAGVTGMTLTTAEAMEMYANAPPEDQLVQILRQAVRQPSDEPSRVVLLDDLDREGRRGLFGRLRDELWELPIQWVVSGTEPYLEAPVDTFFETVVELEHLQQETLRQMLCRRALTGTAEEQAVLRDIADSVSTSIAPCTPRRALSVARDIFLSDDSVGASNLLEEMQQLRSELSESATRVLDGLMVHGPTHAGDEQLLAEVGVTRSRVVQLLAELETAGLVTAQRVGRRRLYSAFPKPAVPVEAGAPGSADSQERS